MTDSAPDDLGLRLFAAWCGTTTEHAATRDAWRATEHSRHTRDGWERVAAEARAFVAERIGDTETEIERQA